MRVVSRPVWMQAGRPSHPLSAWGDDEEVYRLVDSRLEHLEEAKNEHFADANDYLAILALKNTRVLRRRFLARFHHNSSFLKRAWDDVWSLCDDWTSLFDYCRKIDRLDSTWDRQRNYAMTTLADTKRIGLSPAGKPLLFLPGNRFFKIFLIILSENKGFYALLIWKQMCHIVLAPQFYRIKIESS